MSLTKGFMWRPGLALLALAAAALWLMAAGSSQAGGTGNVSISPAAAEVAAGGTTSVSVVIDPPAEELSIWIVEVSYDSDVVQVRMVGPNADCTSLQIPGGIAGAAGCAVKDTNSDGANDTAVAFGGWVENVGGEARGFDSQQTVATFVFEAVGEPGESSALNVSVTSFLGPNAEQPVPTTANGQITIAEAQPGVERVWGDVDCGGAVNIGDAIGIARHLINLPVNQQQGCPPIGSNVTVNGTARVWGDVDCGGAVNIGDAIGIARHLINLPVNQQQGCPAIGSVVQVVS